MYNIGGWLTRPTTFPTWFLKLDLGRADTNAENVHFWLTKICKEKCHPWCKNLKLSNSNTEAGQCRVAETRCEYCTTLWGAIAIAQLLHHHITHDVMQYWWLMIVMQYLTHWVWLTQGLNEVNTESSADTIHSVFKEQDPWLVARCRDSWLCFDYWLILYLYWLILYCMCLDLHHREGNKAAASFNSISTRVWFGSVFTMWVYVWLGTWGEFHNIRHGFQWCWRRNNCNLWSPSWKENDFITLLSSIHVSVIPCIDETNGTDRKWSFAKLNVLKDRENERTPAQEHWCFIQLWRATPGAREDLATLIWRKLNWWTHSGNSVLGNFADNTAPSVFENQLPCTNSQV